MLRVTKLTDYATVVLTVLAARPGEVLSAAELAEQSGLETPTVSKLLKPLAQAGLVEGLRGVHGGYRLSREAAGHHPDRDRRSHGRAAGDDRMQPARQPVRHRPALRRARQLAADQRCGRRRAPWRHPGADAAFPHPFRRHATAPHRPARRLQLTSRQPMATEADRKSGNSRQERRNRRAARPTLRRRLHHRHRVRQLRARPERRRGARAFREKRKNRSG